MRDKTSIAIVTKNRPFELSRCLFSISQQCTLPEEIIVIDNDDEASARKIVKSFQKDNRSKHFRITYHKRRGYVPKCRNFAMHIARGNYLGFVDDDCVLDKHWLQNSLETIVTNSNRQISYVLGETKLLNDQNVIALAQHARDSHWKKQQQHIFDTKNVLLDLRTVKKHQLKFDEKCQSSFYDSADFDFDFQLKKNKIAGVFCKKMIVYHQETSTYQRFVNRAWHRGKLANYLSQKWQLQERLISRRDSIFLLWLLRSIKNFHKEYRRYQQEMLGQTLIKKLIATWLIRVFERYYALGYEKRH